MRRRRPVKIICPHCGSEDLQYRATCYWNKTKQFWEIDEIDGDYQPWCHDCQDEISYGDEAEEVFLEPDEIVKLGLMEFDDDT